MQKPKSTHYSYTRQQNLSGKVFPSEMVHTGNDFLTKDFSWPSKVRRKHTLASKTVNNELFCDSSSKLKRKKYQPKYLKEIIKIMILVKLSLANI